MLNYKMFNSKSVQSVSRFSASVMSDSLQPHGLQHAGFPLFPHLLEFAQTHVCWVSDAIQPSHPLMPSSPSALNHSHHQGLFQWVSSSHQVSQSIGASASTSVLPMSIQGWFLLGLTSLISLQSKRLSRVFSSTTVRRHLFFCALPSLWSSFYNHKINVNYTSV